MAESTRSGRSRVRRSTRVSRQLAEARRRNLEQLARQRAQEQRVEEALAEFFQAADRQAVAEEDCRRRIEPHERAIARARRQRDRLVAEQEEAQARAALAIHEADRTVEQVAELLELSVKDARRLIAAGREAAATGTATQREDGMPPDSAVDDRRAQDRGDSVPDAGQPVVSSGAAPGAPEAQD